ncbi:MAG: YgiT-type zinc finger protein [Bacillaceae bacterium]|nr:YgiT-type zinc finger protein [Bacillaceae bacterium]
MKCMWCESEGAFRTQVDCPWIMPDGKSAVMIKAVPSIHCEHCGITYQEDEVTQKVEESLILKDLSEFPREFSYQQLLEAPEDRTVNLFGFL